MVKNKHLDFAQLIFDQFVVLISGKKRSSYVPYPHWISLALAHIVSRYISDANESIVKSIMSYKLTTATHVPPDPPVSQ